MVAAGSSPATVPTPPGGVAATRVRLPRTTTFVRTRSRTLGLWWWAVAIAIAINAGMVVALSQVSSLHLAVPEAPLAVRNLRRVAATPPAPPPPPETPHTIPDELTVPTAPIALPSLDLPASAPAGALALPADGVVGDIINLPLSVPAFTAVAPPGDTMLPPRPAAVSGPPTVDTPAEREGAFDLDRHYPRAARLRGITGSSRLRLAIDATGRVTTATVLTSTPDGVFEQAAERVGQGLHFRPARRAGSPVASEQELIIQWTIK